ncbi:restriction endonuclease subunit S [Streptococcus oralis]|uniref:restriction endonuclease subunit S n=1 Tax=Streptococcus oralis TaxID=1303 RepID=UPI00066CBF5A|nr:restriction endonuclease subunit S [Streptococcus oralis]MDK7171707.1 restriction endonuclease subunit S [Streptococcus oralis]MDK8112271.1 restriction endonuclease subunit S [Streptococcus oralis]
MSEKLSDVVTIISGGTPKTSVKEFWDGDIDWLAVADFNSSNRYVSSASKKITDLGLNNSNTKMLEKGDLIISARGTVGAIAQLTKPMAFNQSCFGLRGKKDKLDTDYLYYWLKNYVDVLLNKSQGSVFNTINLSTFDDIKIELPSIADQRKISNLLTLFDDKIQTNNQINQELESMAKTLYDYWFVQFDFPDQNGKPYKSSGGKMVYHPELKREIPEGWGVEKIENIAQTGSGGTPKSTNVSYYSNGEIPWINSGELEQTVITSTSNFITEEGLNNSSAKLFPSGTILVAMYGATAGKVSFLTFEASTNQAICAITLTDIRMRYYLKNVIEDLYQYLVKLSTGSARDNLSQDMIKNIKVVIPSNDILDRFYDFSNNIIKEITKKQQENEQLTQLRDWLLPMLMNGQVKV